MPGSGTSCIGQSSRIVSHSWSSGLENVVCYLKLRVDLRCESAHFTSASYLGVLWRSSSSQYWCHLHRLCLD